RQGIGLSGPGEPHQLRVHASTGTLRARAGPERTTDTFRAMQWHECGRLQARAAVECPSPDLSHLSPERLAGQVCCRTNARQEVADCLAKHVGAREREAYSADGRNLT